MSIVSEAGESVLYSGVTFRLTSPVLWLKLRAPASASEQQPGGSEKQAGGQKHKVFFQHRVSFVKSAGADCKTAFGGYHSG